MGQGRSEGPGSPKSFGLIAWLAESEPERENALRADLLRYGLRFDRVGPDLTYDDAWALVGALLHDHTSASYRVHHGHSWGLQESMHAHSIDRLGWLGEVIVRSQGGKFRGKLQPFPRPKALTPKGAENSTTRGDALPIDEVLAWMSGAAATDERTQDGIQEDAG